MRSGIYGFLVFETIIPPIIILYDFHILSSILKISYLFFLYNIHFKKLAPNVPAVCEAFLRAQKNVAEKNRTKGKGPTAVFRSPSRPTGGEAHTVLLNAVCPYVIIFFYYL
jgi:hypothetical protein